MQYGKIQAYLQERHIALLAPDTQPESFGYNSDQGYVSLDTPDKQLISRALSHSLWSLEAYQKQLYKLPGSGNPRASE